MNTLPVIKTPDSCVSFQSELMLAWTKQLYGKAIKAISSPLFDVCAHEHTYLRMHWCRKICANMRDYHSCQKAITFHNEAKTSMILLHIHIRWSKKGFHSASKISLCRCSFKRLGTTCQTMSSVELCEVLVCWIGIRIESTSSPSLTNHRMPWMRLIRNTHSEHMHQTPTLWISCN